MLCFPIRNCEPEGASYESGIHYTGNQGRDFKIESGIASTGRREDEDQAGTEAEDVSSGKKENFSGTESPVEESQGSKEIEKSPPRKSAHSNILEVGVFCVRQMPPRTRRLAPGVEDERVTFLIFEVAEVGE
jgi:hypothetical protein